MTKLTSKQRKFIDEYLVDLNATQAAIRSGYSAHTARQIGQKLLSKVDIKAEIDGTLAKLHDSQRKQLMLASNKAISALVEVAETGNGSARVSAANSILDRAGHKSNEKWMMELIEELKRNAMADDEVRRQEAIEKLIGSLSKYAQEENNNQLDHMST